MRASRKTKPCKRAEIDSFSIYRKMCFSCGEISKLQFLPWVVDGESNQNKTHKQDVSMSCECVSSPSDRTSAHRSPMVCSRRGSASNTAGNWLIHCLAMKQEGKYVYYPQTVQDNQFCHTARCHYSPDKVADLCAPQSSLVQRTVLISTTKSQGSKPIVQIQHKITPNTSRDTVDTELPICFADKEGKTKPCLFPDLISESGRDWEQCTGGTRVLH